MIETFIRNEEEMLHLGTRLARIIRPPMLIYLYGPLGAGKTTLVRGILQGLDHSGSVKSPTYTIVEPYKLADFTLYHFDLYRLNDPAELEALGFRDYLSGDSLCLLEWPERGEGWLPPADVNIWIDYRSSDPSTRRLKVEGLDLSKALADSPANS
ncbi:MAG: tRNA (adenosine(37)-N6)-threonylcarbamoyltransferase complex ATPase subunit type 1 TsaE [Gammaproteobacteria bacterium]|nr:tRNA (adenosine(37)-N6)-threonylcarbamoyltransferase complex ATPase subunit type 1 TsaE [Gammaproteobacteria bacterium]